MTIAPWRSLLAQALDRNSHLIYTRYLQLATVRADGRPANRTVVFREFLADTNQLQFVTDSRSEKVEQIEQQPWGEVCWYFPETREQFRISGQLILVSEHPPTSALQSARQQLWQSLSDAARLQFAWPHPGEIRAEAIAFSPLPPNSKVPVSNFCLLLLAPVQVDHLELRGNPHNRCLYCLDSYQTWSQQAINP